MPFGYTPWWQNRTIGGAGPSAPRARRSPRFKPFDPFKAPPPPSGSYDPALNAQLGASRRGLGDFQQDTATANLRAGVDYGLDRGDLIRTRDRGYFDIDQALTGLQRSYTQLGRRQAEGARASGVLSGGLALQAAAKRAENFAIERAPLDTERARLGEDTQLGLGRLDLAFQRGGIDRGTGLDRARREAGEFKLDIGEQKAFQAAQSGYVPPKPTNRVNKRGVPYREKRVGDWIYRYDQKGRVLSKRRRRK